MRTLRFLILGFGAFLATAFPLAAQDLRPADMSTDEAGLWYYMDKYEETIKTAGTVITDEALQRYTQDILCNLIGEDCDFIRIYIQNVPAFNATMAPNGMMNVYSGLLLRTESEAQLACVIGHEYGHYIEKHSLQGWRRAKRLSNATLILSLAVAAAGGGSDATMAVNQIATLIFYAYSREQESEADEIGFRLASQAGYRADECAYVWRNVIEEQENSSFKRNRKRINQSNVFSTHPLSKKRADSLDDLATKFPSGTNMGREKHQDVLAPYLGRWLRAEFVAKDYGRSLHLLERMKESGYPLGLIDYYAGEAHRLRKGEGDREKAVELWEAASTQAGAPPETWRSLGEHYRKKKRKADALSAYRTYLAKNPRAEDRELISAYIDRLSKE